MLELLLLKGAMRVVGDNTVQKPDIFSDIQKEMNRQVKKWGKQNHPMVPKKGHGGWGYTPDHSRTCNDYECPTADRAKFICDSSAKQGGLTYFHILLEEVCEAIEAANVHGDFSSELRAELIQVAAVTASMIQLIDEGG